MRKIFCLAVCFFLLSTVTASAEENIAVFDLQKVAAACDALQMAKQSLDDKFGPQKTELEKERTELEKKAEEYQKKRPTEKQLADFTKKQREYTEKAQAFMRLLQADEMRVRADIDTVINRAVSELVASKKYTLVLDSAAVPYCDPKLDITDAILVQANAVWKKILEETREAEQPEEAPAEKPAAKPATKPAAGKK